MISLPCPDPHCQPSGIFQFSLLQHLFPGKWTCIHPQPGHWAVTLPLLALCWEPPFPTARWRGRCSSPLQIQRPVSQCARLVYLHLLVSIETSKDLEPVLCLYLFTVTHFHAKLNCHNSSLLLLCYQISFPIFLTLYPDFAIWVLSNFLVPVPWLLTTGEYSKASHIGQNKTKHKNNKNQPTKKTNLNPDMLNE